MQLETCTDRTVVHMENKTEMDSLYVFEALSRMLSGSRVVHLDKHTHYIDQGLGFKTLNPTCRGKLHK